MSEPISNWRILYKIAGLAIIILLIYSLATMLIMFGAGGPPSSAQEILEMLHQNRLMGLLRLDALTTLVMPLYYLLLLSLYAALRNTNEVGATITLLLGCAGLTLFLATPSFLSWLILSDKFTVADEAQKTLLLAAGETILVTDLWHSSSAFVGGLLLQTSMLLISLVMLRSSSFSKLTAWVGVVTHGLDLAHIPFLLFLPTIGTILMIFGGTLYLVWFPLLARDFFRLAKTSFLADATA